jgi:hypothetical protein
VVELGLDAGLEGDRVGELVGVLERLAHVGVGVRKVPPGGRSWRGLGGCWVAGHDLGILFHTASGRMA